MNLPPPITGDELARRLKEKIVHTPLAEGLLYKNASLMISSQPSVGKSVLAVQAAYELSVGLPLFCGLYVPKPLRVWYIQMERPEIESLERLNLIRGSVDTPLSNLFIDVELQHLNFLKGDHLRAVIERGRVIKPDLIIIDPLYGVASGLSKDEVGSGVAKMFTVMKKELKCTLLILHHTTKHTYEIIGGEKVEKDDPFYGAQWLKAHVTGSYIARQTESGLVLTCKKDSHGNLLKEVVTRYDPATYTSCVQIDQFSAKDRYRLFLKSIYCNGNRTFYFKDAVRQVGCTMNTIRVLNNTPPFKNILKRRKTLGDATLYEVIEEP